MFINLGGVVPISSIEWSGHSSTVFFFNGCPFRCVYCHNKELWHGHNLQTLEYCQNILIKTSPFTDAVIFSGGEPCLQYDPLISLSSYSKSIQKKVGLYTNGYFPDVIRALIERKIVDRIFLSLKAPPVLEQYAKIINIDLPDIIDRINKTLDILEDSSIETEIMILAYKPLFGDQDHCVQYLNDIIGNLEALKNYELTIQNKDAGINYDQATLEQIGQRVKKEHDWIRKVNIYSREIGKKEIQPPSI